FSDLTEQKESEMALKQASIQNEQLIASISSMLIGLTPDGHISHWNEAAAKTFNIDWRKAIGRPLTELDVRWNGVTVSRGLTTCRENGQPVHLTNLPYTRSDNREGVLNIHINPYQQLPEELGFLLLAEDITEQKILEGQLAQAQKLEAIGQLAAGIAHEINTPTQYIGDNISFLQNGLDKLKQVINQYENLLAVVQNTPEAKPVLAELERLKQQLKLIFLLDEMPQAVQDALEGVERVTKIVQAMKMFSHPGVAQKTTIDLNHAVESTITVARNEWKYVAEVETDFEPNLPLVPCLPGEFNQVILNLIINAVHAIKDVVGQTPVTKGKIKLTTRHDGDWIEIRVGDSGTGIPEEIRSKIFHPFFTTKEVGRGTGQGLAIAHSVIVEKHGGTIAFETEMGRGTTFILRLPLVPQPESTDVADIH
ncbi:MAG: ATP-binding protein, partial [Anaerolineae bacterium]